MSNLVAYKDLIDSSLHSEIFQSDRELKDPNIYINRSFSGTLQQLFLLRNWNQLRNVIPEEQLWLILKKYEYKLVQLVFDSANGKLIADSDAQDLYKKYYYNSFWIGNYSFFNFSTILLILIIFAIFLIIVIINKFVVYNRKVDRYLENIDILSLLQKSTETWLNQTHTNKMRI